MKRPDLIPETAEDIERIYAYYEQYRPPRIASQLAWRAFRLGYRPDVAFMSQTAEERFNRARLNNVPQIITSNHLTDVHDQFVSGATLQEIMPERAGRVRVLTKDPVMRSLARFGKLGEALGGIPAYRTKDNDKNPELVRAAARCMTRCCGNLLAAGENLYLYPQGTHNSGPGDIKPGIAHIALNVAERGIPVAITTTGMSYGREGDKQSPRNANVIIGETFFVMNDLTIDEILQQTRDGQLAAVEFAQYSY